MKYKATFRNDVLFKYAFNGHNEQSKYLLDVLVSGSTGIDLKGLTVINPNLDKSSIMDKNYILDLKLKTETGVFINVELQNTKYSEAIRARFQVYIFRSESDQLSSGEDYSHLKAGYQICLINDVDNERRTLIDRYEFRNEKNQVYKGNLVHIINVQMPMINEVVEKKGIENLSEFELMIYIFQNGIDDDIMKLTRKEKVVHYMKDLQEEFNMNEELRDIAFKKELMEKQIRSEMKENFNHGIDIGVGRGIGIGIGKGLVKYVQKVYHEDITILIEDLTLDQLSYVQERIYDLSSIEEIKELINNIR